MTYYSYSLKDKNIPFECRQAINTFSAIYKEYSRDDFWIAGGALKSLFSRQKPRDIDIYCQSQEAIDFITKKWTNAEVIADSEWAVQYSIGELAIDVVKKPFPSVDRVLDMFDFTISCCAVGLERIWFHPNYFNHLATKLLVFNEGDNPNEPINTLLRMMKFAQQGFIMPGEEVAKLVRNIYGMEELAVENITQILEENNPEAEKDVQQKLSSFQYLDVGNLARSIDKSLKTMQLYDIKLPF